MTPRPTGRLVGHDLILTRRFAAPPEDVWASVSEPERTARWFGPWSGTPGAGNTITVTMAFEEGEPQSALTIRACEPPRLLELVADDDAGTWHLELQLEPVAGGTELRFIQHLSDTTGLGAVGPGWEYYLDLLVASRDGDPSTVRFDDYYPAQKAYYEGLETS